MNVDYLTKEDRFRIVCVGLLVFGISPTPKTMLRFGFGNGREFGGNLSKVRTEEYERNGWVKYRGKWIDPFPAKRLAAYKRAPINPLDGKSDA